MGPTGRLRVIVVSLLGAAALIFGAMPVAATPPPSPSAPSAPTSLVAYRGNGSVEIAFTAGANGGAAITNYKYQLDGGSWTAFSPAVTTPSVTIGGLTNGTTYSVKLRAVNSVGDGAVSDAVSVTPADVNAINWTSRTPAEQNSWSSVTYGNGTFVAIAWNGTHRVMTSTDGVTWTAQTAAGDSEWYAVTYGNGLFVAVAQTGTNRVMTSPDGVTWTARSAAEANLWYAITYGNGLFVAVAGSGVHQVMTSPDGITWTARSAAEANFWKSVTYGNGTFVAVSFNGTNRVMTSPDGITWTARSAAATSSWAVVTYGNGRFVAVANGDTNRVMTSPDGITWTARSASSQYTWQALAYGNGKFVAVASSGVMTSSDGITWTGRPPAVWNYQWSTVAYGNGKFVALAQGGSASIMTSELTEPTTPDAPTSLAVTIAKGSASVSFTAGADGGSPITNYEYQLDGAGPWTALSPVDTSSPVTIPGLTNGTAYTVKLRAVNALGSGAASSASASFTPLLRLVTPAQAGTLSILAGTGSSGAPTPGPAISSPLSGLNGLAVDASGNIYIADSINNKVFKITSGGTLSVFAGTGTQVDWSSAPPAITPGPATNVDLAGPTGPAVDAAGNVYLALRDSRRVVKITPGGTLSIVAGTGRWFDPFDWQSPGPVLTPGAATTVDLSAPTGVAVDPAGNLYIADSGYRKVLKVAASDGTLSVMAGSGGYGTPSAGPATASSFRGIDGVAVDASSNVYVVDSWSHLVVKVAASDGTLSILAGTGSTGLPSPGTATSSNLGNSLAGVAVDAAGNVYVADSSNNVVEKITPSGTLSVVAGTGYRNAPTAGPVADSDLGALSRVAVDSAGDLLMLDGSYYLLEKVTFVSVVAPSAPTSLSATPADGSASISFTAGADGGASISKYEFSTDGGSTWADAVGTASPVTVNGLTNYTDYSILLRAVNSAGAGVASSSVSVTPADPGPTACQMSGLGKYSLQTCWNPLVPAQGKVNRYRAYVYIAGTTTKVASCKAGAADTGCVVKGGGKLTAGTDYDVVVRARVEIAPHQVFWSLFMAPERVSTLP